jgi:hypothetical protein
MIKNFIIACGLVLGITACKGTGFSFGSETPEPVAPLVLTETNNVTPESLQTKQSVPIPIETLGGDVGDALKQEFAKRGTEPVITTKDHITNTPGAMIVTLDANATKEILSPNVLSLITGVFGAAIPGSGPWLEMLLVLLPFLSSRFRKHTVTAVKRVVPGMQGPNNDGKVPDVDDLREALIDLTKAVTLAPKESRDVITFQHSPQKKQELIQESPQKIN